MQLVWDPLRKKNVALTPEEKVRQWFIVLLRDSMLVPQHMMNSEVSFKFGAKDYRADILVFDRNAKPVMVVECKRPDVSLDQKVIDQTIRYNMVLDVRYIVVTNGEKTFMFERSGETFQIVKKAPVYSEMIAGRDGE